MSNGDLNLALASSLNGNTPLSRAKTEVSVSFLLEIHNLAPIGSEIRTRVVNAITQAAQRDPKAHWARGLMQTDAGDLVFDEVRYRHAVYQGKQDTYAQSAQRAFDELQRTLELITSFQQKEQIAIGQESVRAATGQPLVDLTTPTRPAVLLKAAAASLPGFVERMAGGMDVTVGSGMPGMLTRE